MTHNRTRILGFEQGLFYENTPSDGNIVIDATSKRTGNYGLHVTGQSGVKSTLVIAGNGGSVPPVFFCRFYLYIVALPSTARVIYMTTGVSLSTSVADISLNPDGKLSLRSNAVVAATTLSAMSVGHWYRVEIGGSNTPDSLMSIRIDGNIEIDWVSPGGTGVNFGAVSPTFGVVDTVAAACEFYLDDMAFDLLTWPGNGRVVARVPTAVTTDNANFTATGAASKWQAVAELPPDDDTSYLDTGTTTSQRIILRMAGIPASALQVRGAQTYVRVKRSGASGGIIQLGWRLAAFLGNNNPIISSTAAYVTTQVDVYCGYSVMGPYFSAEIINGFDIDILNSSANASRVTAIWTELDYDDASDALAQFVPGLLTGFEDGDLEIKSRINSLSQGTFARSTTQHKSEAASLKITHASGGNSYLGTTSAFDFWKTTSDQFISFWFYVETLPTSGNMDLFWIQTGGIFRGGAIYVTSAGALNTYARTIGSDGTATANGTIVVGRWYHMSIWLRAPSAASAVTDGHFKIRLDDVTIIDRTGLNFGATGTLSFAMGAGAGVTGGGVVYYDDFILDYAYRHHLGVKLSTMTPDGASPDIVDATFTVTGAASKAVALQELPNDGDTSYVFVPASTTKKDGYALADAPATTKQIMGAFLSFVAKQDSAAGGVIAGLKYPPHADSKLTVTQTTGASYAATGIFVYNAPYEAAWTPVIANATQVILYAAHATNASRVTSARLIIMYLETPNRPPSYGSGIQVI